MKSSGIRTKYHTEFRKKYRCRYHTVEELDMNMSTGMGHGHGHGHAHWHGHGHGHGHVHINNMHRTRRIEKMVFSQKKNNPSVSDSRLIMFFL
jgi:hypothetical protein